jgi:hypothetical protein
MRFCCRASLAAANDELDNTKAKLLVVSSELKTTKAVVASMTWQHDDAVASMADRAAQREQARLSSLTQTLPGSLLCDHQAVQLSQQGLSLDLVCLVISSMQVTNVG